MCDGWGLFELIWLFGSAWKRRYGADSMMSHRGSRTAGQGLIHFSQAKESLLWITVGAVPRRRGSLFAHGHFFCIYSLAHEKDWHSNPHSYRRNTSRYYLLSMPNDKGKGCFSRTFVCSLPLGSGGFHSSRGHVSQPMWRFSAEIGPLEWSQNCKFLSLVLAQPCGLLPYNLLFSLGN